MKQDYLIPNKIELALRIIVSVILIQTLRFKFLGHEDSIFLFNQVSQVLTGKQELEPFLRYGTGIIELIAGIFLLLKPTILYGALLSAITMAGAIKTHFFIIGINFQQDGGLLFSTAIIAFLLSFAIVFNRRDNIPLIGKWFVKFRDKYG